MDDNNNGNTGSFFGFLRLVGLYVVPFSIGSSCLYLFGYWNSFKLNIFQYAGFSDIVGSAIYPLIVIIGIFAFSGSLGVMNRPRIAQPIAIRMQQPVRRAASDVRRHSGKILILYYLTVFWLLSVDSGFVRLMLPLIITLPPMIYIIQKNFIHHDTYPFMTVFMILAAMNIPLMALAFGVNVGSRVRDGIDFTYVVIEGSEHNVPIGRGPELLTRYIGHAGDFDFFYAPKYKTVTIAKVKDDSLLTLGYYTRATLPEESFENPFAVGMRYLRKWYSAWKGGGS
jgi:hypothetical protein